MIRRLAAAALFALALSVWLLMIFYSIKVKGLGGCRKMQIEPMPRPSQTIGL